MLEAIIDANNLNLIVSEIEGDAVFFYLKNKLPVLDQVIDITKQMFIAFHANLERYKSNRICFCGACSTANNLKIKFIAHTGEISLMKVKDKQKPYGKEVISIHRLLKNSIPDPEYLLISEDARQALADQIPIEERISEIQFGKDLYEDIGELKYSFMFLNKWTKLVPRIFESERTFSVKKPVSFEVNIESPLAKVFELVSNLEYRKLWQKGLNDLEYRENRINRGGETHICFINDQKLELKTVKVPENGLRYGFGEELINPPGFIKKFVSYFLLYENGEGTRVKLEFHIEPRSWVANFFMAFLKRNLSKSTRESLLALKDIIEKKETF